MNINATLLGQAIAFAMFVWFCMKFIWPPITNALQERQKRIAEGLSAAERGKNEQRLAEERAKKDLKKAKAQAADIVQQAHKRAGEIVEEAKQDARIEGERLIVAARAEIDQEVNRAREQLRAQVSALAITGAEKILQREIDASAHKDVVDSLARQI